MDKSRQLSVTFPDWFASSVLGAITVVTVSYNFLTGEKQVVRCSDSLFEYVLRSNFQICPSIQVLFSDILSAGHLDNINWEYFFSLPISRFAWPFCSQSQWRIYLCLSWIFSQSSCLQISFFCFHFSNACKSSTWRFSESWHERLRFRTILLSFFSFSPFPKGSTTLCMKNNVACVYRWHAKPFLLYISRNLYSNF